MKMIYNIEKKKLYVYGQVHMNGPPEMGCYFWGNLSLFWIYKFLDFILLYFVFK